MISGRDGAVRAAKINKDKVTNLRHPIKHLIPLEAEC